MMPKGLTADQLNEFENNGYLVLHDVLHEYDLAPVRTEYETLLDRVASRLYDIGAIATAYAGLSFDQRYSRIVSECSDVFPQMDITFPVKQTLPDDPPIHLGQAVLDLLTHEQILDVVEAVIGPEIFSNPTQHLRLKPPERLLQSSLSRGYVGRTAWHQDLAGLLDEALETNLLTVWIAISDASEEQGCLVAIPGSHRSNGGELTVHCPEDEKNPANRIVGRRLAPGPRVPLPVRKGAVVLLHKLTQHASLPNRSNDLRFAFDLRYQPIGQPTGRPAFPGFVARSRKRPGDVLRCAQAWESQWQSSLEAIRQGVYRGPIYESARWESYGGIPPC